MKPIHLEVSANVIFLTLRSGVTVYIDHAVPEELIICAWDDTCGEDEIIGETTMKLGNHKEETFRA